MLEIRNGAQSIGADRDATVASIQQATGKRLVWVRPPHAEGFFALKNDERMTAYEHRRDLHEITGETAPLPIWNTMSWNSSCVTATRYWSARPSSGR